MIRIMSYEINHNKIECFYDGADTWFVVDRGHPIYCENHPEASQKMDEAIKELLKELKNEQ